ncbi:uncharacterized protein PV09_06819 [Verruconis gallopava]|uniref:dolichol kinase n=1 Tax=Verruconis gallopava TaxID=253628 RepID=A0A0D1YLD2_9PEZI|nr:uncharacterized protein PV09_06819 [Verruconis gallopava]KIW01632.1 hypothetical protein PV09_06819 [Verruconis gallopava]
MQPGEDAAPDTRQDERQESSSARQLDGETRPDEEEAVRDRRAGLAAADGAARASSSAGRVPSRSPHPYHRRSVLEGKTRIKPDLATRSREVPFASRSARREDAQGLSRRPSRDRTMGGRASPSESGTEADDESAGYARALPAPPMRPRKGLKIALNAAAMDDQATPLLTPSAIDEEATRFEFPAAKSSHAGHDKGSTDDELREARARFVKRRRAELARRASEVLLLAAVGMLVMGNESVRSSIEQWRRVELLSHVAIIAGLYLLYPVRLIAYAWRRTKSWKPVQRTIRLPAAFDPAPLLYPEFIPVFLSLILLPTFPKILLPNLVLGLASVPAGLYRFGNWNIEPLRWLVSIVPLILSEHTDFPHKIFAIKPYILKTDPLERLEPEIIVALYPLHQSLVHFVHYLTTTSLLPAEVHLMSIGLINLLLCAEMPPTVILQILLWFGGLSVYALVGPVIRWNIALARVPRWRFRRAGRLIQMQQSFLNMLSKALTRSRSADQPQKWSGSDADEDHEEEKPRRRSSMLSLETIKAELIDPLKTSFFSNNTASKSANSGQAGDGKEEMLLEKGNGTARSKSYRPRRNTVPNLTTGSSDVLERPVAATEPAARRRKGAYGRTIFGRPLSSLTQREATARKWAYAMYTYVATVLLILGPIRNLVSRYALNGHEPFGWAIGYLFGNIQELRFLIWQWNLERWVPLPPLADGEDCLALNITGRAECVRQVVLGEANTRLLLCAWCVAIIIVGLAVVLSFTFVEVDTRRKVFHGMMVAMLLPTIFIDPSFFSLALVLMLAIFLLLDLLRASQLPPLSRPIASFLTPYVDGRDLRGPVVVSHIFLLIGCAVPLWLSLAGSRFTGLEPWVNWNVAQRDVSMIAGVVCVGMGDAAASLIGRRYGRHKWPWTGGKSLEGSAAFALAVTVGLIAGKLWLHIGGWEDASRGANDEWAAVIVKAGIAACGASFMEAVLTGGNDNVIVPIVLWVLVRALDV